jgi:thiamine biosynthesis lipoprotein
MRTLEFEALGTGWAICLDLETETFPEKLYQQILVETNQFDQECSRFIAGSEANAFRDKPAGTYPISSVMAELLQAAKKLATLTTGAFDPAIAGLLEKAGYNAAYAFDQAPATYKLGWQLPTWSITGQKLTISGPVVLDIGGIGKGYWIDHISQFLLAHGYPHHLVDGGGDMMATAKRSGEGWHIALEWPGQTDTALGTLTLKNQGFAASDTFRRRWKTWHHLIHAQTKQPIQTVAGCFALAPTAFTADQLTSALCFSPPNRYPMVAKALGGEYVVLMGDNQLKVSRGWPGELFT